MSVPWAITGMASMSQIVLCDATTGDRFCTMREFTYPSIVAFSPDGKRVAHATRHLGGPRRPDSNPIHVCDTTHGDHALTLRGHMRAVRFVQFGPDGKTLVSGEDADAFQEVPSTESSTR